MRLPVIKPPRMRAVNRHGVYFKGSTREARGGEDFVGGGGSEYHEHRLGYTAFCSQSPLREPQIRLVVLYIIISGWR